MSGRATRLRQVALIGLVVGASACGSFAEEDASSGPEAAVGVVGLPDEPTVPSADDVVVPSEHVASCVDYVLYQAFVGNEFWQGVWNDTGQDEQELATVCERIGRDDPVQLAGFHQEWLVIEAGAAPAPDTVPVAPVVEAAPVVPAAPLIQVTARFDADGNDNDNKNDEWVHFTNTGNTPLDVSGWWVTDQGENHEYRFASLVIDAGASVTLFTGCGSDTQTERFWCNSGSAIWNNDGDVMSLFDTSGSLVEQHSE